MISSFVALLTRLDHALLKQPDGTSSHVCRVVSANMSIEGISTVSENKVNDARITEFSFLSFFLSFFFFLFSFQLSISSTEY